MVDEKFDNPLRMQVYSLPELLKQQYEDLEKKTRTILSTPEIFSLQHVILTGCGDSWAAVSTMKYAFEQLSGLRCEAVKTLDLARYYPKKRLGGAPNDPFVIGVSNSGKVARMAEAMERATINGSFTLAITGDLESPLAHSCKRSLKLDVPKLCSAPGTRSYMVAVLSLYLLAIRIGEVRGKYTMDQARSMRKDIPLQAERLEKLIPVMDEQMFRFANEWKNKNMFDFIGGGVDEPTAFFGMAKAYEATGQYATYINTEEWLHLDFFMRKPDEIPTILISSSLNAANSRAKEVIGYIGELGRPHFIISDKGKEFWGVDTEYVIVPSTEYELAFPITSFAPICLLFGYLQLLLGEKSGRGCEGPWSFSKGAACVRVSEKVIL